MDTRLARAKRRNAQKDHQEGRDLDAQERSAVSPGTDFSWRPFGRRNIRIVPGDGDPCPRCGQPTQVREHKAIAERELARPFYYSRWFNCTNASCKTRLIMPSRYIVRRESCDAANADRIGAG
jgi:hypothetical protein